MGIPKTATWLKGLAAAMIGGASNALAAALVDPQHFNPFQAGWADSEKMLVAGAIIAALHYLAKSPLPPNGRRFRRRRRLEPTAPLGAPAPSMSA